MALIRRYTNIHTNKHKNKYRNNHLLLILGYRWSYKTPGCTDKLSYSASAWCVIEGTISKKCSNVRAGNHSGRFNDLESKPVTQKLQMLQSRSRLALIVNFMSRDCN